MAPKRIIKKYKPSKLPPKPSGKTFKGEFGRGVPKKVANGSRTTVKYLNDLGQAGKEIDKMLRRLPGGR